MSSIHNSNYVKITYPKNNSNYPKLFCEHIFSKYEKGKLLDIGCGNGSLTQELQELGYDVHAVDFSDEPKELLKDRFTKIDFQNDNLPFENNTFDIVFSKSVVEHLKEPDKIIKEAYRVLKPGGIIVTLTPSWKHNYDHAFYVDHTHVTPFTRYSLETLHKLENFVNVDCTYFYQLPIVWKYPKIKYICNLVSFFNFPYRPLENINWSDNVNKFFRFSKEVMLLCVGNKK